MIRSILSSIMKARLTLWTVSMMLPKKSDLERRFRSGLIGIMAAVAGGVFAACAAAAVIAGAGYSLFYFGEFTGIQTIIITACASLILITCLFAYGRAKINEALSGLDLPPDNKTLFNKGNADENTLQAIINGFLEGFATHPSETHSKREAPATRVKVTNKKAT